MDMLTVRGHSTSLMQFFYKLYQDQNLCDFEVIGGDGTSLWAHRLILMASSSYIYNICMKNSDLKSLVLSINSDVLRTLLEFCYTGQLCVNSDNNKQVQDGAEMLEMTAAIDRLLRHSRGENDDIPGSLGFDDVMIKVEKSNDDNQSHFTSDYRHFKKNYSSRSTSSTRRPRSCTKGKGRLSYDNDSYGESDDQNDLDIDMDLLYPKVETKKRGRGGSKSLTKLKSPKKKPNQKTSKQNGNKKSCKNGKIAKVMNHKKIQRKTSKKVKKLQLNIWEPKLLNRFCTHCDKSFTSVAKLQYHMTYSHPSSVCSNFRRIYAVKRCIKDSISHKYVTKRPDKQKPHYCKLCEKSYTKYSSLAFHCSKKHRTTSKFDYNWFRYCRLKMAMREIIVPLAKDRKNRLKAPKKKSTPKKKAVCYICEKSFSSERYLSSHLNKIHKEGTGPIETPKKIKKEDLSVTCIICEKLFSRADVLSAHLIKRHKYSREEANKIKHHIPEIKCEVQACAYTSKDLEELSGHTEKCHPEITHNCPKCSMTFKIQHMLKRHQYTCHKKSDHLCQLCLKVFTSPMALKQHEYFKHKIPHEDIKVYKCEFPGCYYESPSPSSVKSHENKHRPEKLFECEYCGMKLKTETIRRKHVAKMHLGIRPFLCQVCGLSFGEKHELQSHITNRHSNERTYQCSHCPYNTAVKATFYTHVFNVHKVRADEDKRELLLCPYCPYTSILKYRYQTHVNSHTNTRSYECKVCGKTFISANALRSHRLWVHSDKVMSCTQCDYQTKTTQKLNEHIRVQHQLQGFKPYRCPYCSFRCSTGGNTRKHVKQVHKGAEVTYFRDDELLRVARDARANGHFAPLINSVSTASYVKNERQELAERPELAESILHIAM